MNILVFDDNATHRAAAEAQFKDHDLTVVETYDQAQKLLLDPNSKFDVVFSDLLVPASFQAQTEQLRGLGGTEMPVGIFIGLLAAVKGGAKYVGVLTDANHHSHPASACFDAFNKYAIEPDIFTVGGAKVVLINDSKWIGWYEPTDLSRALSMDEWRGRHQQLTNTKNWGALLAYLISDGKVEDEE